METFERIGVLPGDVCYKKRCPGYGKIEGCSKWFKPTKSGQKYCQHCEEVLNEAHKTQMQEE